MSLRLKFNLVLVIVFVLGSVGAAIYYDRYLEEYALDNVRQNSQVLMATAIAVRGYTSDNIKPHLDPLNVETFLPETVPAFSATEVVRRLRDRYVGYDYKEAVIDPTNPRDRASDWEARIIEQFRNQGGTEVTGFHGEGMARTLYVARPIKVTNPACLACHSTPQAAPPSMLKVYGASNGFGWKLGDVIGIQLVQVPVFYPLEKARQTFYSFMLSLLVIFAVMFLAMNVALSGFVIGPMARLNRKLEDLATKDFLTDLVNRRRFFEQLETAMTEARVKKLGLSVVMLDLDFFKRINDTYGHDSGDMVLKNAALRVRELLRSSDCAARFGGEEFVLLLRETRIDAAAALAEAARAKIADAPFGDVGTVSASFGVAEWDHKEDGHAMITRADKALYVAKETGRNKVVRAEPPAA
ncbi:MAG: diguanylate cyclase [Proteobacteria bacterium]|nr:diguanylate cyclase [Pseudomonadota bacterium]MBS0461700.1 diguanylate cyclase [Pseudomonadota bacterium]